MREVHEALGDPQYREVVVMAPAQSSKSETGRNFLGWIVDMAPGPVLIVFPTEASCKKTMEHRVIPMFADSPRLSRYMTGRAWDVKQSLVVTTSCQIAVGWAGSPQALASDPYRYAILDEVDKFPAYRGKEADAISLTIARLTTYGHRGKAYILSTPTIPSGPIARRFESCNDRRSYHCHCPGCGDLHELVWDNVTWKGKEDEGEDALRAQREAFAAELLHAVYRCPACEHDADDADRWDMVCGGQWVSEGHEPGYRPPSRAVGYKVCGLSSPWQSFDGLALEYLSARLKGIAEIQNFFNSMIGIPFWGLSGTSAQTVRIPAEAVWAKADRGLARYVAPGWTRAIVSGADPGKRRVHYVTRALGEGRRSRLIDCGEVTTLADLAKATIGRTFEVQGGTPLRPRLLTVDVGGGGGTRGDSSMTDAAYRFARSDPARIRPLKGHRGGGEAAIPCVTKQTTYVPPGARRKPYDVTMSSVDVGYFKDLLAGLILDEDPSLWEVYSGIPADYAMHMAAEEKRLIERRVSAAGEAHEVFRWVVRVPGAANHYFDCEVYAAVAAHMLSELLASRTDRPPAVMAERSPAPEMAERRYVGAEPDGRRSTRQGPPTGRAGRWW